MRLFTSLFARVNCIDDIPAQEFCNEFLHGSLPRYVFGRNAYAQSIAANIDITGFVDDFTDDKEFLNKPVIKTYNLPSNALVVSAVVLGRPTTVENKLDAQRVRHVDYFHFRRFSGLNIMPVSFLDEFRNDFKTYTEKYKWIYELFADKESQHVFERIVRFYLHHNLEEMYGFSDAQHRQYFEDFLHLQANGEIFVDVGGFDGYTSLEFIKRYPGYSAVYIFEPESQNMELIKTKLAKYSNIYFFAYGLGNATQTLRFESNGSASRICDSGSIEIEVRKLDDILKQPFTFLKMDIEGAEKGAIEGARQSILDYHPRLAISVYHKVDDLWRIPELVLSYRSDYNVYLRHYTEGVTETVMFFVPITGSVK